MEPDEQARELNPEDGTSQEISAGKPAAADFPQAAAPSPVAENLRPAAQRHRSRLRPMQDRAKVPLFSAIGE
jgi:hypothetical protein